MQLIYKNLERECEWPRFSFLVLCKQHTIYGHMLLLFRAALLYYSVQPRDIIFLLFSLFPEDRTEQPFRTRVDRARIPKMGAIQLRFDGARNLKRARGRRF